MQFKKCEKTFPKCEKCENVGKQEITFLNIFPNLN